MHLYLHSKFLVAYTEINPVASIWIPRPARVQSFFGTFSSLWECERLLESLWELKSLDSSQLSDQFPSRAGVAGSGPTLCKQSLKNTGNQRFNQAFPTQGHSHNLEMQHCWATRPFLVLSLPISIRQSAGDWQCLGWQAYCIPETEWKLKQNLSASVSPHALTSYHPEVRALEQ